MKPKLDSINICVRMCVFVSIECFGLQIMNGWLDLDDIHTYD